MPEQSDYQSTYDANGNLETRRDLDGTLWRYEWDAENRLIRVLKDKVETARFAYDPLGRRVEKVAADMTTAYIYDGIDIFRERRTQGATTVTATYVHGPGIDEPLARADSVLGWRYFHADGLGSIVKWTNDAGAVAHTYQYDTWGNIEVGAEVPGYAFTGREWDPETGLYYYRARYYDPKVGRFISEDPIGFGGGVNFFTYVESGPASKMDPFGLDSWTISRDITIPSFWTRMGLPASLLEAEDVHEAQHRADLAWYATKTGAPNDGTIFGGVCMLGWKLEQRGFAAEIPVLLRRIAEIEAMGSAASTLALQRELALLQSELGTASSIAKDDWVARQYWNQNQGWRWWLKVPNPMTPVSK